MTRTRVDGRADLVSNEARDLLLDEALRQIARPAEADLRARVLDALAASDRAGRAGAAKGTGRRPWPLRPATALAAAAAAVVAIVAIVAVLDLPTRRCQGTACGTAGTPSSTPAAAARGATEAGARGALLTAAAPEGGEGPRRRQGLPRAHSVGRRPGVGTARVFAEPPVPQETDYWAADSSKPFLPGAPAGDLGDPLEPLPAPPSLTIAPVMQTPIVFAPPVSEMARPVSDFPADAESPGGPKAPSGRSGGTRR